MFEARVEMLHDVVEVFLVQESNFTNSGSSKKLSLRRRISSGWLKGKRDKIMVLTRVTPPPEGFNDGVKADRDMRRSLSRDGLARLKGLKDTVQQIPLHP